MEENNKPELSPNIKGLAMVAMVIGGAVFLLSGGCTLIFASAYPQDATNIWGMGALFFIPAALLFWAGWRIKKRGKNLISTIIIAIIGISLVVRITSMFVVGSGL